MTDPTVHDDAPAETAKRGDPDPLAAAAPEAKGQSPIAQSVTINRPRAELYAVWRDFARLPSFLENVERVEALDGDRSHWVVKAPAGRTVEWDAILTDEREGELIAWRSAAGADVDHSGRITFRDAGARGTVVTAHIRYDPPGGAVGKLIAKLFQHEPAIQARRDLRRFKQLMETGEIATARMNHRQIEEEGR